ncbi:MAG: hypothetical protein EAZ85_03085 [Bacteroidetes bacterium]|nr:MAG: hypothetical protein EAZ85_03085 [Bacteroidota bacterium]
MPINSDLYIFAIGGTGARVVKALTILLASGADIQAKRVIPIFIDPDMQNGDTVRTIELLKLYQNIHKQLGYNGYQEKGFFKTEISTLKDLDNTGRIADNSFRFSFGAGGITKTFEDFLEYSQLETETQDLIQLLFSEDNLKKKLDVGFRGSPNVGTIVLNSIKDSKEWEFFGDCYNADNKDRIFIVSSIFGGTGASGFPLILENLRIGEESKNNLTKAPQIKNARIGAVSVMPYFDVQSDNSSAINSNIFTTKTKEALLYYENNLPKLDSLYYMGDTFKKQYKNSEGGLNQKNEAHFIEIMAATSMLHFMEQPDRLWENTSGTQHYAFGIKEDAKEINFSHFYDGTKKDIYKPMVCFHYFAHYIKNTIEKDLNKKDYAKRMNLKDKYLNDNDVFYPYLKDFVAKYYIFMEEMLTNERSFVPFDFKNSNLNKMLKDKEIKTGWLVSGISEDTFTTQLNNFEKESSEQSEKKFMKIMYQAMEKVFDKNIIG